MYTWTNKHLRSIRHGVHVCVRCGFTADYTVSNHKYPCPWNCTILERM